MCLGFTIINIISYLYFNIISTVIKTFLGVKKNEACHLTFDSGPKLTQRKNFKSQYLFEFAEKNYYH